MQERRIERRSHDYYRHGTSTLFAALEVATGDVCLVHPPSDETRFSKIVAAPGFFGVFEKGA